MSCRRWPMMAKEKLNKNGIRVVLSSGLPSD